ncbi:MAG TPA: carboxypeptidase-like regulatory domain-containing protein [Edaphobacter sp.]
MEGSSSFRPRLGPSFRFARLVLLLPFCALAAIPVLPAASAMAQQRGPVQRVVQGKVTDHENVPIAGAVIYLKDSRTVKSFIANDQGQYRFGQLAAETDYEIWAEHNGQKSSVRTISSFDSKREFYIDLKIGK